MDELGFVTSLQPLARAFDAHQKPLYFADLFDVKRHELVRRGTLQSEWDEVEGRLTTTYRNGDFHRALQLRVRELRAHKFGGRKISFMKNGAREDGTFQVSLAQIGPLKVGSR